MALATRDHQRFYRRRLRVLHVIPSLGAAGAEFSLLHLLRAHRKIGIDAEVAALGPPYTLAPQFESAGIKVHRLELERRPDALIAAPRLFRLGITGRYDVVRSHLFTASAFCALAFAAVGPPVVASHHALDFDTYPTTNARRAALKRTYGLLMRRFVTAHVGISRAVADHYVRHLGLREVKVIPNGFPVPALPVLDGEAARALRATYGASDSDFLVVCPGRFSVEKGQEFLLQAIASLAGQGVRVRALLFGAGPRERDYRLLSKELRIEEIVRIEAPVAQEQLMRIVASSDALALPSPNGEGFGRVLAEAMLLEKPVITTGVGGALDFIEDGRTGLLTAPKSGEALAGALGRLARDPALRDELGRAARAATAAHFGIDAVAARWLRFYEQVLGDRRSVAR